MPGITYSFLSVQASITGPGGNGQLGNGAGTADEGITVEMLEEKDLMTIGADGTVMHSLRASNAARITVRFLKTSPQNAFLNNLYNFQRLLPANWGQNAIVISDVNRGDVVVAAQCAFARQPQLTYAKDAGMNEWVFYGTVNEVLGAG